MENGEKTRYSMPASNSLITATRKRERERGKMHSDREGVSCGYRALNSDRIMNLFIEIIVSVFDSLTRDMNCIKKR